MDTSYLEKQVSTIINKLHELFDDIGVSKHDRDSRESELFAALSETLHSQLRIVTNEKHALAEEAEQLITSIRQMHMSLEGQSSLQTLNDGLKVTYPLKSCLETLRQQQRQIAKAHGERYEQVKKLAIAIDSYSSHLEPDFLKVALPPLTDEASCSASFDLSHKYFAKLDDEFTRVYDEYQRRLESVQTLCAEMINLWAELGTPQAQTDSNIIELSRDAPEQLGLQAEDVARLKAKRDRFLDEKNSRQKRLSDMAGLIHSLWERLCIPEEEQRIFLARNRGCGMRTINEFEDELARLNELKHQNLGLFVEEARIRIQSLWDSLYFSEEEMLEFTPAFSDVNSDALLASHEAEISRLESLRQQRGPVLDMIDKHKLLIQERDELTASSQDASRLLLRGQKGEKRDPTRLLREEKMRKRIAKDLPKVEMELRKLLDAYDQEYGRPFLVLGHDYLDDLAASQSQALPPRSKTPSGLSRSQAPAKPGVAPKTGLAKPTPQSTMRSKTPNHFATMRGNPPCSSITSKTTLNTATKSMVSPSRIPARVPLSSTHANNSPERKYLTMSAKPGQLDRMRPPRLPPPKMKDLFVPLPQTPNKMPKLAMNLSCSTSIVRQIQPEDPYDDSASYRQDQSSHANHYESSNNRSYASSAASSIDNIAPDYMSAYSASSYGCHPAEKQYSRAPRAPGPSQSRQISEQSAASNPSSIHSASAAAASENWETFDEGLSEDEMAEACTVPSSSKAQTQDAKHYNLGAATMLHKRLSPDEGWRADMSGKRLRNEAQYATTNVRY